MLTNIKIKNAYSIKELNLSFLKGKYAYKKDMISSDVINPAALYGGNGSGKSSVVNAINDLVNLLISDNDKFYPLIANFNSKNESSLIELTFRIDENEYKYSLTTSFVESCIEKEVLLVNNITSFTRNKEKIIVEDKEYLVKENLFLAIRDLYSRLGELSSCKKDIKVAYDYLTNIVTIKGDSGICNSKLCNYKSIEKLMVENAKEIKRVISTFKDFPLFDFLNEFEGDYLNIYTEKNQSFKLPGFLISDGMFTITKILSILINLDENSLLVIDTIERNLHPSTVVSLIKEAQKRGVQILFTSNNTALMQELRPDQIYFARWKNGESYYFRLSNIYDNIREINNIEKMYLSNTFDEAINQIINID